MKTLNQFLEEVKKHKKQFDFSSKEVYRPDEPVHFKHVPGSSLSESLEEDYGSTKVEWTDVLDNDPAHYPGLEHAASPPEANHFIETQLVANTRRYKPSEKKTIAHYTGTSGGISGSLNWNRYLSSGGTRGKKPPATHLRNMDAITNQSLAHPLHVYSGINFNPAERMKNKEFLHLPAFTSTSHDKTTAAEFAIERASRSEIPNQAAHVLHVHLKEGDRAGYISHKSEMIGEYETVLPRNTVLRINPMPTTTSHSDYETGKQRRVYVWHATVHHQD